MCGFAGFVDSTRSASPEELAITASVMAEAVRHRGPDDYGVWVDADAGVAFGHRRLSIIDLSPEGHQPMLSQDGRLVLLFNGEIYNFRDLRRELEGRGRRFRGHSDTEILLAAMSEWGIEAATRRAQGMFAFAVWDRGDRTLHLGRDRLGEKPLYYGWTRGTFVFGSELKALRRHPAWEGEIDRDALASFLRFAYVPTPLSIYRGIRKLPPGTLLRIDAWSASRDAQPVPYWSLREVAEAGVRDPFRGDEAEAADALESLLGDAVSRQMVADVPVGAFLSGGVDSSTVVALMSRYGTQAPRTFTIGSSEQGYDEAPYARAVAAHLGTRHTELLVTPAEARSAIPLLPEIYDEPFADSSQIPTFLVARLARRDVTVSLSGDGGDELFGGYNRYFLGPPIWNRLRWIPRSLRGSTARLLGAVPAGAWKWVGGHLLPLVPGEHRHPQLADRVAKVVQLLPSRHPEALYKRLITGWPEPARVVRGSVEPMTMATDSASWPQLGGFAQRMMYVDALTYLPDDILTKVDRAGMAVSLETRMPFLDPRVVEFAWKLPPHMKVRNGAGKWALRRMLHRYVPPALLQRPKMGFAIPIDRWLRGSLRPWAEALLDESRLRQEGFFDPEPVHRVWRSELAGALNAQHPLWCVLMFQAWLDQQRPRSPVRALHGRRLTVGGAP